MEKGRYNKISDVKGIKVGHKTLADGDIQTGVTVLLPSDGNIFKEKWAAASYVINGFGKTSGLVQIDELGTLESIIGLTNTLSVGTVQQAIVKHMLKDNPEIGVTTGTINTVVGECNDGYLNDIRSCIIQEQDVYDAIDHACEDFELGAIGAGRGMSCFQMKGGIGSASRLISIDEKTYTIGALVLTNFGLQKDFILEHIDIASIDDIEKGSIIMILATDIPMSSRQLKRMCKRMPIALGRLGSYMGNGSGDIVIAFSTGNMIPHTKTTVIQTMLILHEDAIDLVFRGAIEACEEAILTSLYESETVIGRDGNKRLSLKETLAQISK